MNFRVINGVETVELTAAERRALERALPILDSLGRKADDDKLRTASKDASTDIKDVLNALDAQAVDTDE